MTNLVDDLDIYGIDEEPLLGCLWRFEAFAKTLPEDIQAKMLALSDKLSMTVARNVRCRNAMISALVSLCRMPAPPSDPGCAIKEWISKQAQGQSSDSCIERSLDLLDKITELLDSAPAESVAHDGEGDEIRMVLDSGESRESFTSSYKAASGLHSTLCNLPLWGTVRGFVQGSLNATFGACLQSMNLGALGPGPAETDDSSKLDEQMKGFFHPSAVSSAVAACGKIFTKGSTKEWAWCEALKLVTKLSEAVPDSEFRVDIGKIDCPLITQQNGITTDKTALLEFLVLVSRLMKISSAIAFIDLRYVHDAEPCVRDNMLKDDLETSVSFLRTETHAVYDWFGQSGSTVSKSMEGSVHIDVLAVQSWLAKAREVSKSVCATMYERQVQAVSALSEEVSVLTPKYDHLITDEKFNATLTKKQILNHPGRKTLSKKCVDLHKSIAMSVRLKSQWDVADAASGEGESGDASPLDLALDVFKKSKRAITVTAALNALLELTGEQKIDALEKLENKADDLPKSLVDALKKEKEKDESVPARQKRAKNGR